MSFNVQQSEIAKSMLTFSGADIKAYFENLEVGNLQGISLSVNREVRPVFVMGRADVVSYSRGKRGVAGSLVMTVFDRDAFYEIKKQAYFAAKAHDATLENKVAQYFQPGVTPVSEVGMQLANPGYSDQIPPFDITLVARNEFGNASVMRIYGVHIVSEGMGMSVDDNVAESQFTFVAHGVDWWKPLEQSLLGGSFNLEQNISNL